MQFATRQGGLKHIAGIHGTFALTGTNHRMDFIDKDNRLAFIFGNITQYRLETLLKLATVLCTSQ